MQAVHCIWHSECFADDPILLILIRHPSLISLIPHPSSPIPIPRPHLTTAWATTSCVSASLVGVNVIAHSIASSPRRHAASATGVTSRSSVRTTLCSIRRAKRRHVSSVSGSMLIVSNTGLHPVPNHLKPVRLSSIIIYLTTTAVHCNVL